MIDVEILGVSPPGGAAALEEIQRLCTIAASSLGISGGHVAVELVSSQRIAQLNAEHRRHAGPTDVLSFPIDGLEALPGKEIPRELGDIVICLEHTADLREAVLHGMLHLLGMDHERDGGEMLQLQQELLVDRQG